MTAASHLASSGRREGEILEELCRRRAGTADPSPMRVLGRRVHGGSVNVEVSIGDPPEEYFVKWLRPAAQDRFDRSASEPRARLNPFPDPSTRMRHERAALGMIQSMVERSSDSHWSSVGVEGLLGAGDALVLERMAWPTLADRRDRAHQRGEPGAADPDLEAVAHSFGAWASAFHRHDDLEHTRVRLAAPDHVAELVDGLASRLERAGHADGVGPIRRWLDATVPGLPEALPLVLAHGDLSPKNVLVDDDGRLAVVDTAAEWRMPPHVDLAFLSVMLELDDLSRLRSSRHRRRTTEGLVDAVISGYGPTAPPRAERAVFEVVVLLDKLATLRDPDVRRRGRVKARARRALLDRRLRDALDRRMADHD